jgi:hypothetical protein
MGNFCYSKNKKPRTDVHLKPPVPQDDLFCKPKINSNSLICYKAKNKTLWEESLTESLFFQSGSIFGKISAGVYILVGGLENGEICFRFSLDSKSFSYLKSPPVPLSYGFIHIYRGSAFIIGSVTHSSEGHEKPADFLSYNLKSDEWSWMPRPPVVLALPGSYLFDDKLFVIGGFLNYPHQPSPFQSLLVFNFHTSTWVMGNIDSPISNGLPNCIVTGHGVIIVGGHDPFDNYQEESKSVFLFSGSSFNQLADLPDIGQLRFTQSGCCNGSEAHLYSEDDILFSYDFLMNSWSFIDLEEKLQVNQESPRLKITSGYGDSVYFYSQKDCDLIEYCIKTQSTQMTGPSTFHKFPKYPGVGLLLDGKLLIAGGLDEKGELLKSCWTLEPKFHQSLVLNDLPQGQYGITILQVNRDIYAVAGVNEKESLCSRYSQESEAWKELPSMPYLTFLPGCGHANGKIYCMGGCAHEEGATILYLVQVFCIKSEKWEVLNVEYPYGVYSPGILGVGNNRLLCFGGVCKGGIKVFNTYFFDGNRFSLVAELPEDDENESTMFRDPPVLCGNFVYAFAGNAKLFKFDLQECFWSLEYPTTRV